MQHDLDNVDTVFMIVKQLLTPFKPDVIISHSYQLDQSISVLRVVVSSIFHFYSNLTGTFCKRTMKTLIRQTPNSAVSDLDLHFLPMSHSLTESNYS